MASTKFTHSIVIVGGGIAGILTFNDLATKLGPNSSTKLILVTPRPYFNSLPGALRVLVTAEGNLENKNFMYFTDEFKTGNKEVVNAKVTSIAAEENNRHVTLDNGQTIPYTVLLLTPGSIWEGPVAFPETKDGDLAWVKTWRDRFEKANDIVLVGGGAVSAELAGELKDYYPNKNVTIVHSQHLLMNATWPEGWRKTLTQKIAARGVRIILGDRIDHIEPRNGIVTTAAGERIPADLVAPIRGPRPNTRFIAESLGEETLNSSGFVRVLPSLQLVGHPNIFAAGDIIDWKEEKQAVRAMAHASIVANNIVAFINENNAGFKQYKGTADMIVVTNGRNGGAAYLGILWGISLGDWFVRWVKSKDLRMDATAKSLKLQQLTPN